MGYFLTDLAMILWFYPSLGGTEYVSACRFPSILFRLGLVIDICFFLVQLVHHLLSLVALSYAMLTGEAQFYVFLVLLSEATTPGINLRWYQ